MGQGGEGWGARMTKLWLRFLLGRGGRNRRGMRSHPALLYVVPCRRRRSSSNHHRSPDRRPAQRRRLCRLPRHGVVCLGSKHALDDIPHHRFTALSSDVPPFKESAVCVTSKASRATSRFDPFEVCPGVGTVVTAVVACGVLVPYVGNDLWWYVVYQSFLVLTWSCVSWKSYGVTFYSMCFTFLDTWLAILLPTRLRFAWEACSLGSDLPVRLKAWATRSYCGLPVRLKA
ncbi:hypothetical protein Taro_011341 [Colocasia esculenta]|uniref:Uncharacterized protein n=1 Tax=Colocasia esculenta TaxID=4460 RepID=A0A843U5M6_COLES|nr:hypothetical protein [Colocasia esculenta]